MSPSRSPSDSVTDTASPTHTPKSVSVSVSASASAINTTLASVNASQGPDGWFTPGNIAIVAIAAVLMMALLCWCLCVCCRRLVLWCRDGERPHFKLARHRSGAQVGSGVTKLNPGNHHRYLQVQCHANWREVEEQRRVLVAMEAKLTRKVERQLKKMSRHPTVGNSGNRHSQRVGSHGVPTSVNGVRSASVGSTLSIGPVVSVVGDPTLVTLSKRTLNSLLRRRSRGSVVTRTQFPSVEGVPHEHAMRLETLHGLRGPCQVTDSDTVVAPAQPNVPVSSGGVCAVAAVPSELEAFPSDPTRDYSVATTAAMHPPTASVMMDTIAAAIDRRKPEPQPTAQVPTLPEVRWCRVVVVAVDCVLFAPQVRSEAGTRASASTMSNSELAQAPHGRHRRQHHKHARHANTRSGRSRSEASSFGPVTPVWVPSAGDDDDIIHDFAQALPLSAPTTPATNVTSFPDSSPWMHTSEPGSASTPVDVGVHGGHFGGDGGIFAGSDDVTSRNNQQYFV